MKNWPIIFLVVFIGGGIGATCRFGISTISSMFYAKSWIGTLIANILGCFLFYILMKYLARSFKEWHAFLRIGVLGSLTTFSTFSYEVVHLFNLGKILEALLVLVLNVFLGIVVGIGILR